MKRFFGALFIVGICLTLSAQLLPTRRRLFASSGSGGGGGGSLTGGTGTGTPGWYWLGGSNFITSGSTMTSTNIQIPTGKSAAVLFFFSHYNSGALRTVTSLTLNSQTMLPVTNSVYYDGNGKSEVYGLMNPTPGTNNALLTLSGTITEGGIFATVVTNAITISALFQESTGVGNIPNGWTNIVTTITNAWVQNNVLYGSTPGSISTTSAGEVDRLGPAGVASSGKHTIWTADQISTGTTATNRVTVSDTLTPGNHIVVEIR